MKTLLRMPSLPILTVDHIPSHGETIPLGYMIPVRNATDLEQGNITLEGWPTYLELLMKEDSLPSKSKGQAVAQVESSMIIFPVLKRWAV